MTKGRYELAMKKNEELIWSKVNGEYCTHVLIVSLVFITFSQHQINKRHSRVSMMVLQPFFLDQVLYLVHLQPLLLFHLLLHQILGLTLRFLGSIFLKTQF